jgi:hypothetical protein
MSKESVMKLRRNMMLWEDGLVLQNTVKRVQR